MHPNIQDFVRFAGNRSYTVLRDLDSISMHPNIQDFVRFAGNRSYMVLKDLGRILKFQDISVQIIQLCVRTSSA